MRLFILGSAVACMIAGGAEAAPTQLVPLGRMSVPVERIRWTCNQYRCLDQWTGNETASFCDEDGCHPRTFGRRDPGYGYAPPPPRRYRYGFAPPPPGPLGYGYPPPPPEYGYQDD